MRNIYVCSGLIVRDVHTNKVGKVITTDPISKLAIIRDERSYWTQGYCNLEVASYREVK